MFAIAFADVAGIVPSNIGVFFAKFFINFFSFCDEFWFVLEEWRNAEAVWRKIFWEFQNDAFFAINIIFGVSGSKHCHDETFNAETWLNDVRNESFAGVFVAIFHIFARFALNIPKVKIGAIGDTHELFATDWVVKFDIDGAFRIMGAVFWRDLEVVDHGARQAHFVFKKIVASFVQFFEVFFPGGWVDEIFDFHLFKFAGAKDEIARADFVAKSLTLLSKTKRQIWINRIDDIFVICENALGGFWAQVGF